MRVLKIVWSGIFLLMIILVTNSCAFSPKMCRNLLEKSRTENYDIVVIPGVPFKNGQWDYTMKERVLWSKFLYDQGIVKNIMFSGAAVYSPYREGEIMALYAEKMGIPKAHIFTETLAEHSTENIYYSYKKARKLGFNLIALASDPFQTKMLRRFIRKIVDPEVGLIPVVSDTVSKIESGMTDPVIDYKQAFVENFVALPDRESYLERLKGTRGLDIDTSAYK